MQEFKVADQTYTSRLLIGTAGYPNFHIMTESIAASGAEIATVSMRRVKFTDASGENLFRAATRTRHDDPPEYRWLFHCKGRDF